MISYVGEDAPILFQFLVDGDYVVPASATFTVRDHTGSPIPSLTDQSITLTDASTQATVVVPAANNTVAGSFDFENRTVEVRFVSASATYNVRKAYRVSPWLNYTGSPADVRRVLGVFDHELSDDDIDIPSAYFQVKERDAASLATAIGAGDVTNQYANKAIVCQAALNCIPSLQLRAAQAFQDDTLQFKRITTLDFNKLLADITAAFNDSLISMVPIDARTTQTDLALFVVNLPIDAITGS